MPNKTSFSTNPSQKTITVERNFDAPLPQVWDAWTKSEILDQWWAPKPWKAETKRMSFKPGGHWLYAMVSPEGSKQWCRVDYNEIVQPKTIKDTDSFCNEDGQLNKDMPPMHWIKTFTEAAGGTTVRCDIAFDEASDMEKIIAMGFEEGFKMGLNNLDEYLAEKAKG